MTGLWRQITKWLSQATQRAKSLVSPFGFEAEKFYIAPTGRYAALPAYLPDIEGRTFGLLSYVVSAFSFFLLLYEIVFSQFLKQFLYL